MDDGLWTIAGGLLLVAGSMPLNSYSISTVADSPASVAYGTNELGPQTINKQVRAAARPGCRVAAHPAKEGGVLGDRYTIRRRIHVN
jgi:hypothetical protein